MELMDGLEFLVGFGLAGSGGRRAVEEGVLLRTGGVEREVPRSDSFWALNFFEYDLCDRGE